MSLSHLSLVTIVAAAVALALHSGHVLLILAAVCGAGGIALCAGRPRSRMP